MAPDAPDPEAPRFARGTPEFDRALAFFDGTYAVALTLLVTTLDGTNVPGAWADLAALWAVVGNQIVAFFLAFAIVAFYWRSNHAFVARLHHLSGRLITVNLVLLAFVVLLPFSTDALGEHQEPLATAVFAGNVAVISSTEAVMSLLAWRTGLSSAPPSPRRSRLELVPQLVPPVVFLASIPVAYLVSSSAARLSWLALAVLDPVVGILVRRRAPLV
ncbi:TMEM175 family protein [Geodermatophilus maliterrae]|uniref:TMEM175 family protein n=1 Tax=Geodermatophilus maliterrae TaxID=3162531 RepID=A0ABV3XJI6_9ACTN